MRHRHILLLRYFSPATINRALGERESARGGAAGAGEVEGGVGGEVGEDGGGRAGGEEETDGAVEVGG